MLLSALLSSLIRFFIYFVLFFSAFGFFFCFWFFACFRWLFSVPQLLPSACFSLLSLLQLVSACFNLVQRTSAYFNLLQLVYAGFGRRQLALVCFIARPQRAKRIPGREAGEHVTGYPRNGQQVGHSGSLHTTSRQTAPPPARPFRGVLVTASPPQSLGSAFLVHLQRQFTNHSVVAAAAAAAAAAGCRHHSNEALLS